MVYMVYVLVHRLARVQKLKHQSYQVFADQVFAGQSSQEYEHAEKPNDLSHAKLLLGKLRQARVHDTLRCCSEGGACTAITCHVRSNGTPSSCKDVVGSHRGVFATSTRPRRMHGVEEEASSVF